MVSNSPSFAQKQQAKGREVLNQSQARYTLDEQGGGLRTVPLRNKRNGKVVWIKEEEVFYYTSPVAKPLTPGDRRADGESLFVRITPQEAAQPNKIAQAAKSVGLPTSASRQAGKPRRRKRGRRG